ncbi:uncharacterized protein LOC133791706 [Humulus lupulus]|uniref:uncharacterized protein LOC133791706 n=1 Tax=Humulus lupulus TaxID=3486 RepID=UPI002B411A85|nr:uncharacterized protein LOC133791706 [Humulus lupulus]
MIDTAKSNSAFRGFSVGKDNVDVSHLQFFNDTIFFVNDEESLVVLLDILKVFSVVSGLSINLQKCQLLGINLNEEIVERQAKEIGCEVGQWPIQFLGLPLGDSPRSKGFWEPVISKCANRLDSWSAFLSRGGRLTLIQSVLSSIPIYYLSLFCIPKSVVGIIEKLMRDFLWEGAEHSGADHLVSWNEFCKSRSHGGLGIGNLALRNKAFLFKWLWWFPMESTSLWHRVVRSRYGSDGGHWDTNVGGRFSTRGPWKDISSLYEEYRSLVYFKVGRGDRIRFWEDVWIGDSSFKLKYPDLFRVSEAKNYLIKDVVVGEEINSSEGLCLDFRFRRNLFDWEIPSLVELFNLIKFVDLPQILEDKRIWIPDTSGVFNCKTAFQSLSCANLGPELPWAKREEDLFNICHQVGVFAVKSMISRTILTTELPYVLSVIMNENKIWSVGSFVEPPSEREVLGDLITSDNCKEDKLSKKHELWFLINGKPVRFSIQEFAIVSGLYTGGELTPEELNVVSSNNNLKNKYFKDRSIKIEDVANVLDNIPKEERMKDRVKLCFIYLLSAFLLNSSAGTTIDLSWLRLVDNLEIFDQYPWGRLVYEKIIDQITRVKFRKDHNKDIIRWNFICCPWIFQIWICEAMPKLGEMIGQRIPGNHIPRWIGWKINVKVQNITVARISKLI